MTKFFNILTAFAALSLFTACSSDEVVEKNESDNVIAFKAYSENSARSASFYCNYSIPKEFDVHAEYCPGWTSSNPNPQYYTYFEWEKYKQDGDKWVIDGDYRYWPKDNEGLISFVALKDYGTFANPNPRTGVDWKSVHTDNGFPCARVKEFVVETKASEQLDFIYAVDNYEERPAGGISSLNFRHALCQVVFRAKTQTSHLFVEINGIKFCNLPKKAAFELVPYDDYTGATNNSGEHGQTPKDGTGNWIFDNGDYTNYVDNFITSFNSISIDKVDTDFVLTDVTDTNNEKREFSKAFLFIPNSFDLWNPAKKPKYTDAINVGVGDHCPQAYILLSCKVRNVSDYNSVKDGKINVSADDYYIWGSSTEFKEMAIPLYSETNPNLRWLQGKKYIYTFVFTKDGSGGYDADGNKVLVPVKLDVTVDDFGPASQTDISLGNGSITTKP